MVKKKYLLAWYACIEISGQSSRAFTPSTGRRAFISHVITLGHRAIGTLRTPRMREFEPTRPCNISPVGTYHESLKSEAQS